MESTHPVRTSAGPADIVLTDRGSGQPTLLLHGGAGPQSVTAFADQLAATQPARVLTPTHPGFAGSVRPAHLDSIAGLAAVYVNLLEELELTGVTVIGNSIGGWIAAELALLGSPRVSAIVLVDAVGLEVAGHPVVDFFGLTMDEVLERSYYDPARFRIDPSAMPPAAQAAMAGNRAALAVYGGTSMTDPAWPAGSPRSPCRHSCCGATATASQMSTTAAPTPRPFRARSSASSATPGTSPRSSRPTCCCARCAPSPPTTRGRDRARTATPVRRA
jgi:pimeloyl-ACP methyl ester carboxylesterase